MKDRIYCRKSKCIAVAMAMSLLLASALEVEALITSSTYSASAAGGVALENMSTGTTQLVAANQDDTASSVTNIGFDFWYDGVRFNQFSVNANGICRLGGTVISATFDNSTGFADTFNAPKIAPYYDDLRTGNNGKVHFKVIGTAPNRKLVVEWLNEQIPRLDISSDGAGTFQMWLFETTGVIEFVYGSGMAVDDANGGYSVGLQSGDATNFASVTTSNGHTSYLIANNTQTDAITPGTAYIFTPNIPKTPTNLSFTNITTISMTLNWKDNANNEVGYAIYNSTDGTNFNFVVQTAVDATSQDVSGLTPGVTYFWRVYAVSEGGLSNALAGSRATAAKNVTSVTGTGNWSATSTWVGGVVPGAGDNVTIKDGSIVTIDTAAVAYNLTVGQGVSGQLQFDPTTARSLTLGGSATISSNANFITEATNPSNVTTHVLSVGGNLTNNGTLDFCTNPGLNGTSAGASITFTGAANASFSGSGVSDIRAITINKGTAFASTLELNFPNNFTICGATTDVAGFLTLTNGTLKISGNFAMTSPLFTSAAYTIPATGGIWLNNPNFVVAGTSSGKTTVNNGLFQVSQGTYNIGVGAGDEMGGATGAQFIIEGGTVNVSGRLDPQGDVAYTQTGGTINVATVGNNRSSYGSFEIFSMGSTFTMSGGTINVINRNTGSVQIDYDVISTTTNVTGGLLVVGAAGAPTSTTYYVQGTIPNLTINPTMTMIVHTNSNPSMPTRMRGTTVINGGTILSTATGNPRFDFAGNAPMTYTGGVFGTAAAPFGGIGISANSASLTTLNSPIITNRVNLFRGGFINSNQITLGNGGTSSTTVQIGATGITYPGGSFDVSPVHNQGTGGQMLVYAFETSPRVTGFEINPTRVVTSMSVDDSNLTITGGDLTVSNSGASLTLTNGRVTTGANTLALSSTAATLTRTNGYVDGNLRKALAAAGAVTFEIGTADGYSPATLNITAGTFPNSMTVGVFKGREPNYPGLSGLQRYWKTAAPADWVADLTFPYIESDVVGDEKNYVVGKYSNGSFSAPAGASVNMNTDIVTVPGATALNADWIAVDDSDLDGMPNSYEKTNNFDPNNPADANADADSDGQSNLAEYLAGTDPHNRNSVLRIRSISRNGSNWIVSFDAIAGKLYRLEYKTSLSDANWQMVSDLNPNISGTTQITDFSPVGSSRFYRIRVVLP